MGNVRAACAGPGVAPATETVPEGLAVVTYGIDRWQRTLDRSPYGSPIPCLDQAAGIVTLLTEADPARRPAILRAVNGEALRVAIVEAAPDTAALIDTALRCASPPLWWMPDRRSGERLPYRALWPPLADLNRSACGLPARARSVSVRPLRAAATVNEIVSVHDR